MLFSLARTKLDFSKIVVLWFEKYDFGYGRYYFGITGELFDSAPKRCF